SIAVITSSTTAMYDSTSNVPSCRKNFSRLSEARLQLELSSDMYSEQGLDAVIRPCSGFVCHALIVSSYCKPGSAHSHAACAMESNSSRARTVLTVLPSLRAVSAKSASSSTARMKASDTRTELLAFWNCTEAI